MGVVYVIRNGELVEKSKAEPLKRAGHFIISDNLDYVRCTANGKRYTSKSRYTADVKAMGYQILGNDKPQGRPKLEGHPERAGHALYRNWEKLGGS